MNQLRIPISADELDLDRCLFSGQMFRWHQLGENQYRGVDQGHVYQIRREGGDLSVATTADRQAFDRLFNLARKRGDIELEIVKAAPEMEPFIGALPGLRILQPADATEVLFSFLCTANNHLKRIAPMVARLAERGEELEGGVWAFPRTDVIAAIPEGDLRAVGFGYRAASIPLVAKEVQRRGGDAWIESLREVGYEAAHRELVSIKSIGNKLADCICLYGLHYEEAVPIDTHLWQAACRVFFPEHAGTNLTDLKYRQVGDFFRERFGKLAGWAHLYLYYENMLNWRTRG